jgi:hypothetical protein
LNKNKIFISVLLLSLTLIAIPVMSGSTDFVQIEPPSGSIVWQHPQMQSVTMPNGYFAYVLVNNTLSNILDDVYIWVIDSQGNLQASSVLDIAYDKTNAYSIVAYDDDKLAFIGLISPLGSTWSVVGFLYDTNTYTLSNWFQTGWQAGTTMSNFRISELVVYNNEVFGIGRFTAVSGDKTIRIKYTPVTPTIAVSFPDNIAPSDSTIFVTQDELLPRYCYVWLGTSTPQYYYWDLENYATLTLLASHPFGGGVDYRDSRISLRYIGGGVYHQTVGTEYYFLYHTWAYSDNDCNIILVHQRLRFNASGIAPANLEAQDRIRVIQTTTVDLAQEIGFYGGYVDITDLEDSDIVYLHIYHEDRHAIGEFEARHQEYTVTDWSDFAIDDTTKTEEEFYAGYYTMNPQDVWWKEATSTFGSREIYDQSWIYLYYDMIAQESNYDITWTYTPSDDPPITHTRYLFTGTTTLNDFGYQTIISVYFDDQLITSKETDTQGVAEWYLLTTIGGVHNLTVVIYDSYEPEYYAVEVGSETVIYVFELAEIAEGEEGTPLGTVAIQTLMFFLPIFVIILVPAYIFFEALGYIGFLIGLITGATVGTMAGIVPTYFMALVILVVVLGFVYTIKNPYGGAKT